MNIKNWNRALLTVVLTLLFLVGLVLIKILLHGSSKFEWGSVSDWVSAGCNSIIAFTAIAALMKANNYFRNKLTEENISLWLKINDIVSSLASSATVLWLQYDRMISQWNETDDIDILKHHYLNFLNYHNEFTAQLHKLDECNFRLKARDVPYAKSELLISLIKELSNFNTTISSQARHIITVLKFSEAAHPFPVHVKNNFINIAKDNLSNPLILNDKLQKSYHILREFGIDDHHFNTNINNHMKTSRNVQNEKY